MKSPVRDKAIKGIVVPLSLLSLTAILYFVNPSETQLLPCLFNKVTGLKCAGCGMTRAGHQILHWNLSEAWNFNPLIFVITPVAMYLVLQSVLREWFSVRLPSVKMPVWAYIALGLLIIVYTVIRNI